MRRLSKMELRSTRQLARTLTGSGISYEATCYIIGMRLKYMRAFSVANLETVFKVKSPR